MNYKIPESISKYLRPALIYLMTVLWFIGNPEYLGFLFPVTCFFLWMYTQPELIYGDMRDFYHYTLNLEKPLKNRTNILEVFTHSRNEEIQDVANSAVAQSERAAYCLEQIALVLRTHFFDDSTLCDELSESLKLLKDAIENNVKLIEFQLAPLLDLEEKISLIKVKKATKFLEPSRMKRRLVMCGIREEKISKIVDSVSPYLEDNAQKIEELHRLSGFIVDFQVSSRGSDILDQISRALERI